MILKKHSCLKANEELVALANKIPVVFTIVNECDALWQKEP